MGMGKRLPSLKHTPLRIAERCALRKARLDELARKLVECCEALPDVLAVYAFGSYAQNKVGIESDLDALIIRDTSCRRIDRENDIRKIVFAPEGLDLLVVTPHEFENELRNNSVGQFFLSQAVLLKAFDRNGVFFDAR